MTNISELPFGTLSDGRTVRLWTLSAGECRASVTDWGATLVSLAVPGRHGRVDDVVLGFGTFPQYAAKHPFFGSTVGRFANRIAGASFEIDGKTHGLWPNNNGNSLHGGFQGFDKRIWEAEAGTIGNAPSLSLSLLSPDGDEGYPGALSVRVTYRLESSGILDIDYVATTTAPTPVSLTNHSYFNLKGQGRGDILDHELVLLCDRYLPVDDRLIPTGALAPVAGTPFDFRTAKPIRVDIEAAGGFDHCWEIPGDGLRRFARVVEPSSGRMMTVDTTMPGVQFYSGNFLSDWRGKFGAVYDKYAGFCLETQFFPDSPNRPGFPDCVLRPGNEYRHRTVYAFSVQ